MPTDDDTWLGRFVAARPISSNGSFRVVACRDARTARAVVVVTPDRGVDDDAAKVALTRLYEAHRMVKHPAIAPALALHTDPGQPPYVIFDVPAQMDFQTVLALCRRKLEYRVGHAEGDAFAFHLREGLSEAARHRDPQDGGPLCLGAIGHTNVLFANDGRFWLLGLGHNVIACDEHGRIGGRTVFAAPEFLLGARASPIGDYIAIIYFVRSVMEFSQLAPAIVDFIKGAAKDGHGELVRLMMWLETKVVGAPAAQRATVEEAVEVAWSIRRLVGFEPDLPGFQLAVARVIAAESARTATERPRSGWQVAADGRWFARGDKRVTLRSQPMCSILKTLLDVHERQPGLKLSVADLLTAGWPEERRIRKRAGANRVYVAINGLRRHGLGDDLESDGGYRLSPAILWTSIARDSSKEDEHD